MNPRSSPFRSIDGYLIEQIGDVVLLWPSFVGALPFVVPTLLFGLWNLVLRFLLLLKSQEFNRVLESQAASELWLWNTTEFKATDVENQKRSLLRIRLPGDRTKSFLVDGISPSHAAIKFFNKVPNHKQLTEYDINQVINGLINKWQKPSIWGACHISTSSCCIAACASSCFPLAAELLGYSFDLEMFLSILYRLSNISFYPALSSSVE